MEDSIHFEGDLGLNFFNVSGVEVYWEVNRISSSVAKMGLHLDPLMIA